MSVPPWVIAYTVLLLLGLTVGLLFRFVVTLVVVIAAVVILGVWMLGLIAYSSLAAVPAAASQFLGAFPIGPQALFTVGSVVFLIGLTIGLLLTTRLRGLDRPKPA